MDTIEKFNRHVMSTYGRLDIVLDKGQQQTATAEDGKQYIDFGTGIGTNSLGYCDKDWADAVCAQVRSIQHTSNYYYTKVQADFAEKLCSATGYSKIFFGNSGAEANECAIKLARKYSFDKYGKDAQRNMIITLVNSFHGRTLATLSATGQEVFHNYFFPFLEGFVNVEANNIDDLKAKLEENKGRVCAVMFEFVQGEGGVCPLTQEFVDAIFEECAKDDILTIADEVQTGVGRTGAVLTSKLFGVKPNITTLAKGLAGGIPIGACLADESCCDVLTKSTHGSTFGGNPLACAGGNVVIGKVSDPAFIKEINRKAELFRSELAKIDEVEGVDGMGLMIGVRLKTKKAADILAKCADKGLLILTAKEKLRFLPPLNISDENIIKGMEILKEILDEK